MRYRLVLAALLGTSLAWSAAPPERVDAAFVETLVRNLDDDTFDVRQEADDSLRSMGKAVVPMLKRALEAARSAEVRGRLRRIVYDLTIDERVGDLLRHLTDGDAAERDRAAWALRQAGTRVVPLLVRELKPEMPAEKRKRVERLIAELAPTRP